MDLRLRHPLVLLFVFSISCIIVTSALECPGEPPSRITLPVEGKGALQFEFDNPAIIQESEYPPVVVLWGVFDLLRGYIRLDVPNPSIITEVPSNLDDVIYLSLIFRFPQNSLYVVNYSNHTCTSYPISYNKTFEFPSFFDKFTYRGTENINTLPAYKWSASIPLIGDFVYFDKCGQAPLQLQYTSTHLIAEQLEEIIEKLYQIIADATQTPKSPELLTPQKLAEADVGSSTKGLEKLAAMMDKVYSGDFGDFTTWDPADSKFFERVTSNLPLIEEGSEKIFVPEPNVVKSDKEKTHVTDQMKSNEPAKKEPATFEKKGSIVDRNSKFNYFVSRLAILNWVSGPVDQLSFVPISFQGPCVEGEFQFEFPPPNITHPTPDRP